MLKPTGRVLLLGTSAPGGVATACVKVARGRQRSLWRVVEQVPCQAGGVCCEVVVLHSSSQSEQGSGKLTKSAYPDDQAVVNNAPYGNNTVDFPIDRCQKQKSAE